MSGDAGAVRDSVLVQELLGFAERGLGVLLCRRLHLRLVIAKLGERLDFDPLVRSVVLEIRALPLPTGIRARGRCDDALIKALARAFRWKKMLESGEFGTITELARRERIVAPFLTRTMRLAQLAPDLVEGIGVTLRIKIAAA